MTDYNHDNANQMTLELRSGTGGNNYTASYDYDHNGNRHSKTQAGVTHLYHYDSHDHLTSITIAGVDEKTYAYDNNGNMTSVTLSATSATTSMTWNYDNRLTQITYPSTATNTFQYNGLGLRVQKIDSSGTVNYATDGASPASAVLADTNATYTPGLSERRGGTSKFYHSDALGSTRGITNSSQSATDGLLFDAFGNTVSRTGTTPTPFGFVGSAQYQTDADSGLQLLGNRYYDASTGRFISSDPAKAGLNWYDYASNNPLRRIDPRGLNSYWFSLSGNVLIGLAGWDWTIGIGIDDGGNIGISAGGHVDVGIGLGGSLGPGIGVGIGPITPGQSKEKIIGDFLGYFGGAGVSAIMDPNTGDLSGAGAGAKLGPTFGGGIYEGDGGSTTWIIGKIKRGSQQPYDPGDIGQPLNPRDPRQNYVYD